MSSLPLLALLTAGATAADRAGVFVLGVDGMDPQILQRLMDEGRMPHFTALAAEGTFQELQTSWPPQSPVAWSNFVTGMNPGGHGIYDFIHRDPATYHPISSASPAPGEAPSYLQIMGYILPLSADEMVNNRGGVPFWDSLHDAGVDVEVYRIPGNFPTPPSDARVLGGMGTIDMRGGYGTYTLFTDRPVDREHPKGDIQRVSVQDYDLDGTPDTVAGTLKGPPDVFHLKPGEVPGTGDYLTTRITFHIDPEHDTVVVKGGHPEVLLRQGEWSDWVEVTFDALPRFQVDALAVNIPLMPLVGMVRFYAKELRPDFQVYASPVNMSPSSPPMAIASPDDFSAEIEEEMGPYYTQGMPEETDALKDGVFDDDDYLAQVALVQDDTRRMLDLAVDRFDRGDMTFVYVSDVDLQCHMLWRHADPKDPSAGHPARDPHVAARHAHDIERFYVAVDELLARVRSRIGDDAVLMVMSDHGFQPYTRKFHLNAWLRDEGYLVLKDGATTGSLASDSVDWSRTKAYGLGFNGLYLNLAGREGQGIVQPAEAESLAAELSGKLTALLDPDHERRVVREVARAADVYSGSRLAEAPDLIVGYDRHYGCSDESTLGEITEGILEDNTDKWSGNHLMSPAVVPGILLVNRPLSSDGHRLVDLTATLLAHYEVRPPAGVVGKPVF